MWNKIKGFCKKYWEIIVGAIVFVAGFFIGKSTRRADGDFDKLRADNTRLRQQIESFRAEYERLVNLNRLNEQQLDELAGQLEVAGRIAGQAGDIDSGNAEDIDKLRQTNKRLADWISKNGAKLQDNENSGD